MGWRRNPDSWLKVITMPVYKNKNIKYYENYRGISLLNSGCKIYTNIIRNKWYTYYKSKLVKKGMDSMFVIKIKLSINTYLHEIQFTVLI
jgi:hypothetical protein